MKKCKTKLSLMTGRNTTESISVCNTFCYQLHTNISEITHYSTTTQHSNNIAINVTIQAVYLRQSSSCQHPLQTCISLQNYSASTNNASQTLCHRYLINHNLTDTKYLIHSQLLSCSYLCSVKEQYNYYPL